MGKMYNSIIQGLQEAVEDAQGKHHLNRRIVEVSPLQNFSAQKIKQIRVNVGMSQRAFAGYLGVSQKTVEAWEAGINKPSGSANRLLTMIGNNPEIVEQYPFVKSN